MAGRPRRCLVVLASLCLLLFGALRPHLLLAGAGQPRHLVVLQHGLSGQSYDLRVLAQELERRSKGGVLAYSASANVGKNLDGVAAGGRRLAEEVRSVVRRHGGLAEISFVGNSLGGLYTRYAVSELMEDSGLVAGLTPEAFVTIACPHLGVRSFTYLPVPSFLQGLSGVLLGKTGEELMLRDEGCLLRQMATEGSRFLPALRTFRRRSLYANLWGDFMVPYGTAAIEPSWGAGWMDESRAADLRTRPGLEILSDAAFRHEGNGLAARVPPALLPPTQEEASASPEFTMAKGLEACGWRKFAAGFRGTGTLFPLAHNKIAALQREGWRRALFSGIEGTGDGESLMSHAAGEILGDES